MKKFLMMLLNDANITTPTFFVEIVTTRKFKKINVHTANAQHVLDNILTNSWLNQCVAELVDENAKDGTKHCRVKVHCPISHDEWTIYYSDETTEKAH